MMARTVLTQERLMDLERTVAVLDGQLRTMQWELQQAKVGSLTERVWRSVISPLQGSEFMSAVCNRWARPNTKVVTHDR